jgi:membrane-associated phospholipid phosphatase
VPEEVSVVREIETAEQGGAPLLWRGNGLCWRQIYAKSWIASGTSNLLKGTIQRERPDGSDMASFPSGHSTRAFSYATFASRNLELVDLPEGARTGLRVGLFTLAGATAWARVEAGKHYPSDVLAGAALGRFMAPPRMDMDPLLVSPMTS